MKKSILIAGLCAGLASGCASLSSEGEVGGQPVLLDGTGAAWIDATKYEVDGGEFVLRERASDETALHLMFSSASFDPGVDMRTLPMADRLRISDEISRGDSLNLVVLRGDRVAAGDSLRYDSEDIDPPESGPYLAGVSFRLGLPTLDRESEYPDEVKRVATGRTARLDIEEVEERLIGVVDVEVTRADIDDGRGAQGSFTVRFDVELLPERLAECNFDRTSGAGVGVDPCATLELN